MKNIIFPQPQPKVKRRSWFSNYLIHCGKASVWYWILKLFGVWVWAEPYRQAGKKFLENFFNGLWDGNVVLLQICIFGGACGAMWLVGLYLYRNL